MGLPPERVELLRRAGLVHDIGKLTVPEMLLFKPNGLTAEERRLVQDHAAAGADLLGEYDALQEIAPFVRHHHERYDGQGYPDGLAGEAIPLERVFWRCPMPRRRWPQPVIPPDRVGRGVRRGRRRAGGAPSAQPSLEDSWGLSRHARYGVVNRLHLDQLG